MSTLLGIRVVRSPIHGYGVRATRDFAPGEVIAGVDGILCTKEELVDDRYSLWLTDELYFDMVDQTRWINHSCDPNAEIEADVEADGSAWARVVALRPIMVGEEITYDYGFSVEHAEPCSCGAQTCRGWIVEEEELPLLLETLGTSTTK